MTLAETFFFAHANMGAQGNQYWCWQNIAVFGRTHIITSRKTFLTPTQAYSILTTQLPSLIFVYLYLFFLQVPASCCKLDTSGEKVDCESKNPVDLDEIYRNDCFVEAVVFVRGHATIIGGVAVAIASIMVCVLNQNNNKYLMKNNVLIVFPYQIVCYCVASARDPVLSHCVGAHDAAPVYDAAPATKNRVSS